MLSKKIAYSYLRPCISCHVITRYLRGGCTVELKNQKRKIKAPVKEERRRLREMQKSNTGVGYALHHIREREGDIDPDLDSEVLETYIDGVENVDEEFGEKLRSAREEFDRKSLNNIKRKYFKTPKLPNMVPYTEKQDMKILHESDPENWDAEKLAESFPVTPEIAKKILRSPFTAYSVEQVKKHDEVVKRNWKLFKEGKLQLSDELRAHYEKFIDRVSFEVRDHVIKKYLPPKPKFGLNLQRKEFASIIEKYQQTKPDKIEIDEDDKITLQDLEAQPKMISEESFTTGAHNVTLDTYRSRIKKHPKLMNEMSKLIVDSENRYLPTDKSRVDLVPESEYLANAEIMDTTFKNSLPSLHEEYPLRIQIPNDKWKRNQVYQVKDRFYDDSGHFLYRVPGLFS